MRKTKIVAMAIVLIALLSIVGCSSGSGGTGGSGADFDSSLYYTKADIDNYIMNAMPRFVPSSADITAANSSWSDGVAFAGSIAPRLNGGNAAVVRLTYSHPGATEPEDIGIRYGDGDSIDHNFSVILRNVSDGETRTILVFIGNDAAIWDQTAIKWMTGGIPSGASVHINSYIVFYDPSTKKP